MAAIALVALVILSLGLFCVALCRAASHEPPVPRSTERPYMELVRRQNGTVAYPRATQGPVQTRPFRLKGWSDDTFI